ncbi:unnamed protein product [Rhizoctonia solani]|uniref:NADH:flavin oxidoreductase/NADH oxidase N-terminal domain-containing protein n=1 Tax=Rhizoctonia solani TaxID=456999 RepID=A0A8H3CIM6_9AGAM|nr:unnamed protein product [Rhizoctonia solani]
MQAASVFIFKLRRQVGWDTPKFCMLVAIHKTPTKLSQSEIKRYAGFYAEATRSPGAVREAGFDGVEIHTCNGGLNEQFIEDIVNKYTDNYGGSIKDRPRFVLEVVEAVVNNIGAKRTGIRLSPWSKGQEMGMRDPVSTYAYIISELAKRYSKLAYILMVEPGINSAENGTTQELYEGITVANDFAFQIWSLVLTLLVRATTTNLLQRQPISLTTLQYLTFLSELKLV